MLAAVLLTKNSHVIIIERARAYTHKIVAAGRWENVVAIFDSSHFAVSRKNAEKLIKTPIFHS